MEEGGQAKGGDVASVEVVERFRVWWRRLEGEVGEGADGG